MATRTVNRGERRKSQRDDIHSRSIDEKKFKRVFTKERVLTYALVLVFPPLAIYRVNRKNRSFDMFEKIMYTLLCSTLIFAYIKSFL